MKTLTQVAVVASLVFLLSAASYAAGQIPSATAPYRFPPMVLPVAGPAVSPAITPGSGPETTSAPAARSASTAEPKRLSERIGAIFTKARESFVRADLKVAASQVRRSAAVLRKEESKATGDSKKELAATALELDRLAMRIEQAKVKAGSELDTAFARADRALARQGREMANTPSGHLEMTTPQPGISSTAARQAMPSPRSINAAYAPSDKHAEGSGLSYEELNKRIDTLSREISVLREDVKRLKHEDGAK